MSSAAQLAPFDWDSDVDDEGHRTYQSYWRVVATTSSGDGSEPPDNILSAANLPLPGTPMSSVVAGGNPFAYCLHKRSARIAERDKNRSVWTVTIPFTTKGTKRCTNTQVGNPLLEPWKVSGGGNKWVRAATRDKDDDPIVNSAGQRFRGELVQIDESRPTLRLSGNVAWISLPVLNQVRNAVNDATFWGCAARTIKCTEFTWEQKWYGSCAWYFTVNFAFEINYDTWDLKIQDEGDFIIDPDDATKWLAVKDNREQTLYRFPMDGAGNISDPSAAAVNLTFRVRKEVNFATIGFPASIPGIV